MAYRCVATSVAGFVQQLAVAYVTNGYWFYVFGRVPDHKEPASIDRKIIDQYDIDVTKWTRTRRKKSGKARVQYLRFGRSYVILATHGEHPFFEAEGKQIRDIRRHPLHFMDYSIGCRKGRGGGPNHPSVRIQRDTFLELKTKFERAAIWRTVEELTQDFLALPYESYAPVRDQLRIALRAVNRKRKLAGLEPVPREAIWLRRMPVKPFD